MLTISTLLRTYLGLGLGLLIIGLVTLAHLHPGTEFTLPLLPSSYSYSGGYQYDTSLQGGDTDNLQLSHEQCTERYPDLYVEADRAKSHYRAKGGISQKMVQAAEEDGASARLVILNNKLYVKAFYGGINSRTQAAIAAVYRTVITSPEPLPDVDFVIQTSDAGGGDHPHFVLDRTEEQKGLWLMPDFGFYSWPEPGVGAYTEVRDKALAYEMEMGLQTETRASANGTGSDIVVGRSNWDEKVKKLLWRGVPMVEVRQDLIRASANQPWSDVRELNWGAVNGDKEEKEKNNGDLKSPAEHCQYAFLAHVEGWAYSGRLKYLQQCRSVIVAHPMRYIQHYHHLFNTIDGDIKQNMVEVPLPLEEHLPAVMERLIDPENREWVERIADNSWKSMREGYISPAANECYYRYVLRAYAQVQTFKPSLEGRSVPYESFLLTGSTHWDPHR